MTRDVITITADITIRQAKNIMRDKNISGMPVVDQEMMLLGLISVADIIKAMENNNLDAFVSELMTVDTICLHAEDTVGQALQACRRYKYGRFPVIDSQAKVVGVLTAGDVLARLAQLLLLDQIDGTAETVDPVNPKEFNTKTYECLLDTTQFDTAGSAASSIKKMLTELGLPGKIIRRAAVAAYEAEMNVFIHAHNGVFTATVTPEVITITVSDEGPGIMDIDLAMQTGYSTASDEIREMGFGAGMGLPNIKASADRFSIESSPQGTILIIKILAK